MSRPQPAFFNKIGRDRNGDTALGLLKSGSIASIPNGSGEGLKLGGDGTVLGGLQDMKRRGLISDQQCVALGMAAVGIHKGAGPGGNVHDWRKG